MKKTIYIVHTIRAHDEFEDGISFEKQETIDAFENVISYMTQNELKESEVYISYREVETLDGETGKQCYDRLIEEDEFPADFWILEPYHCTKGVR